MVTARKPRVSLIDKAKASISGKVHKNFADALHNAVDVLGIAGTRTLIEDADTALAAALQANGPLVFPAPAPATT